MARCATCWRANTVDGRTQCTGCLNRILREAVMLQPTGHGDHKRHQGMSALGLSKRGLPGMPRAVLRPTLSAEGSCALAPLPDVKLRRIKTKATDKPDPCASITNHARICEPKLDSSSWWWQGMEHGKVVSAESLPRADLELSEKHEPFNRSVVSEEDLGSGDRSKIAGLHGCSNDNSGHCQTDSRSMESSYSLIVPKWHTSIVVPSAASDLSTASCANGAAEDNSTRRGRDDRPACRNVEPDGNFDRGRKRDCLGVTGQDEISRLVKFLLGDGLSTLEIGTCSTPPGARDSEDSHSGTTSSPVIWPTSSSSRASSESSLWERRSSVHLEP